MVNHLVLIFDLINWDFDDITTGVLHVNVYVLKFYVIDSNSMKEVSLLCCEPIGNGKSLRRLSFSS